MRGDPLLGPCSCRRGIERDNCPACEGTGTRIDFAAIHAARRANKPDPNNCPDCGEFLYEPHAPGCPAEETKP